MHRVCQGLELGQSTERCNVSHPTGRGVAAKSETKPTCWLSGRFVGVVELGWHVVCGVEQEGPTDSDEQDEQEEAVDGICWCVSKDASLVCPFMVNEEVVPTAQLARLSCRDD